MQPPIVWRTRRLCTATAMSSGLGRTISSSSSSSVYAGRSRGGAAARRVSRTDWTPAAGSGKAAFITGRQSSRPLSCTRSSCLTSIRPPRTFTDASLRSASRYRSSLSSTRSGTSAARRSSAAPNDAPKVRHSQRGTIVTGRASGGAAVSISVRIVRVRARARQGTCTSPAGGVCAHVAPPCRGGLVREAEGVRALAGGRGVERRAPPRRGPLGEVEVQPPGARARVLVHRRPPVAADRERRAGRAGVEQPPPGGHVERVAGDDRDALRRRRPAPRATPPPRGCGRRGRAARSGAPGRPRRWRR